MFSKLACLTILTILFFCTYSQDPPLWPLRFDQTFIQTYNYSDIKTTGRHWYDYSRRAQRIDRTNGQNDLFCGSVFGNTSFFCSQILINRNFYIMNPEKQQCCICCINGSGCQVRERNWLQQFTFDGTQKLDTQECNKWTMKNYLSYYATIGGNKSIPRRMNQRQGVVILDYIPSSYSQTVASDSIFGIPVYCKQKCPSSSYCSKLNQDQLNIE